MLSVARGGEIEKERALRNGGRDLVAINGRKLGKGVCGEQTNQCDSRNLHFAPASKLPAILLMARQVQASLLLTQAIASEELRLLRPFSVQHIEHAAGQSIGES